MECIYRGTIYQHLEFQERVITYLLLEFEDGELEFGFNFRVLGLNTFQTVNPPSDRSWQAVDVSRRFTDEASEFALGKSE
jgi:hypothetical protein